MLLLLFLRFGIWKFPAEGVLLLQVPPSYLNQKFHKNITLFVFLPRATQRALSEFRSVIGRPEEEEEEELKVQHVPA